MPIRIMQAMIQMIKYVVGNGLVLASALVRILMKAIMPVTTTMMVSSRGILIPGGAMLLPLLIDPFTRCHCSVNAPQP
jgi:hypothetical protein